ncbi:hypothetical protein CC85DRAFT_287654 [Cutaneotrichosporon oleaginosum]|uniref:RING-type E3 ubiquitin transferase n=1 Tax=Cutaneotrichosporon oleaginosum TaxID=879819 RepID=A0A0J0XGP7_9TREE|nr:uncharacterized protein CC85DRAFT_287654 [Cutaneotrichosporon oleaginosum]KLT40243.1 hypothetical protein CC85DRAFT_287654 [Cutaneotrichosporon oleaginosum]
MSDDQPDPRSPRGRDADTGGLPTSTGNPSLAMPMPPGGFPGVFVGEPMPPRPQRSLSSMLFLTMFFFFMSQNGGNQPPLGTIGPDGEIRERVTELSLLRQQVAEYEGFLNGTGNWTEPPSPSILASSIVPTRFDHSEVAARGGHFFPNMTGWYRHAVAHPVDLLKEQEDRSDSFFRGIPLPAVKERAGWNQTLADELRGEFDWMSITSWDLRVTVERGIAHEEGERKKSRPEGDFGEPRREDDDLVARAPKWAWVRGGITVGAPNTTLEYKFYGLHHIANGTYELFSLHESQRVDIRHIPTLYPDHHNETAQIVLTELKKDLQIQEDSLLLTDVKPEEPSSTKCPLLIHLSLPPLPAGVQLEDVLRYDSELANPTGLLFSLKRPPTYWQGVGLGGVIVGDQCGFVAGLDRGRGVPLDDFWRKTVNYAAYATLSQLLVLFLLVNQMERTRTPSTLAKVSLWTIVLIALSDSWICGAHLLTGVLSDNRTSLPMLVTGFAALCTAIVFGPRYAVLLHRIQAPERIISRPPRRRAASTATDASGDGGADESEDESEPPMPWTDRLAHLLTTYPGLKWLGAVALMFIFIQIASMPSVIPFVLFAMQSIWVPQIYRNARRGSNGALGYGFVIGTSIGRLALPLYALVCPDYVFLIDNADWVWGMVVWQAAQIAVLFAQDRFGPAFFLPKRFAPAEGYDYHPLLPAPDAENAVEGAGEVPAETTCSICMEEVNTHPDPADGPLLSLNARRSYAVAPCHHLFHTKCLQQWMALKTICPLCKRPLPPL